MQQIQALQFFSVELPTKVMRKSSATGAWTVISTTREYNYVEPASLKGDTTYFISETGSLYFTASGLSATPTISLISNAPTSLTKIESLKSDVVWAIDSYGTVHFSAYGFAAKKFCKENFNGEIIKEIVASDDRKTIYAVSKTGKIFRY